MSIKYLEIREKVVTYSRKLQAERLVYSVRGQYKRADPHEPELLAGHRVPPNTTCSNPRT